MIASWILIIHSYTHSINGADNYSSIRFNSEKACEQKAYDINHEGACLDSQCRLRESERDAECVKDSDTTDEETK